MKYSPSKSVLSRFKGRNGKIHLVQALLQNSIVGGDQDLAKKFVSKLQLLEVHPKKVIVKQGNSDNDLYLILAGKVSIVANGREVAMRTAGSHFGEMALIDQTAVRSSTVIAVERSILAKISEITFTKFADKNPILWRRIAVELGNRLRERNKFLRQPHSQPEVFIGSSSEGISIAQKIQKSLSVLPVVIHLWQVDVFKPSNTVIEDIITEAEQVDFAIIVLTPDDITVSRGKKMSSPRDNAILELGLFFGSIGRNRTFLVKPKQTDIKIPSDLLGVTCLQYFTNSNKKILIASIIKQLKKQIRFLGPR